MPDVETHIDTVEARKSLLFSDIQSAYHHVPVAEAEQDKTAL